MIVTTHAPAIALVAGLGNPGPRYAPTRHNAGFWFLEAVAAAHRLTFRRESRFGADVASDTATGDSIWLLAPRTFMNLSGDPVGAFARYYKITPERILVVHDELDLPPGTVRLKRGGGHGGHNGLRDIIAKLGSSDFLRLRLGIGHPGSADAVTDYLLTGGPGGAERADIDDAIARAVALLPRIIAGDYAAVMNELHRREPAPPTA